MKVTAIIPNEIIEETRRLSGGKNITEALVIALTDWNARRKFEALTEEIRKKPLRFQAGFSASRARAFGRRSS